MHGIGSPDMFAVPDAERYQDVKKVGMRLAGGASSYQTALMFGVTYDISLEALGARLAGLQADKLNGSRRACHRFSTASSSTGEAYQV